MSELFLYERATEQPSLTHRWSLLSGMIFGILQCVNVPNGCADAAKPAPVVVLDMVAVIHMVRPTSTKTFS